MSTELIIRNILVGLTLSFLLYLIFKKKQDSKLNWAMFYSALWVLLSLLFVNAFCVKFGLWKFNNLKSLFVYIPYDLLFIWVVLWGIVPPLILKGKRLLIAILVVLWTDVLFMPLLEKYNILTLGEYWLIGEGLLIMLVFIPAHLWSKYSLSNTNTGIRSIFQFICIALTYCIGIPYITWIYFPRPISFKSWHITYSLQFMFIITLPALIAIVELLEKGKGTPFPYDPTTKLVRSGSYSYIRNPIQWSLTFLFVPLAIIYNSPILLIGILVSIAYTIGVSNPQEFLSMEQRFGEDWRLYKKDVPAWRFLWKPINHPTGTIYFKRNCNACLGIRKWFEARKTINLNYEDAHNYIDDQLIQVTYVDKDGTKFTSVKAIAIGLEHINLAWASLGWFMRLPLINYVLQIIIDAMGLKDEKKNCDLNNRVK